VVSTEMINIDTWSDRHWD